jgi:RNA polymerase sigma-70 factor (ECF subfamily)
MPRPDDWDWHHLRRVAVHAARSVVSGELADDAAQEAVVQAWRHAGACKNPANPAPWMWTIARREALRLVAPATSPEDVDVAVPGPEERLTDMATRHAVGQLAPAERSVLVRFYWAEQRDREIAEELGIPLGTVKIRLHRARKRLRVALRDVAG